MKPSVDPTARQGQLATVGQRVVGAAVDLIVSAALFSTPFMLLAGAVRFDRLDSGATRAISIAGFIFMSAYHVIPTARSGRTLGKLVVGTMVVRQDDGAVPGWAPAALRWVLPALAWRIPFVGWAVALGIEGSLTVDPLRRGIHDRLAGTIVVQASPRLGDHGARKD